MSILTCLVTHDRLPLTQRCVGALQATMRPQDRLIVVDNASTDGTVEWLQGLGVPAIFSLSNDYPGLATNKGWDQGLTDFTPDFLHRCDNDIEMLPGWGDEVEAAFATHPDLALLGILNLHEDRHSEPHDALGAIEPIERVGGNVVIPTAYFRDGMRWVYDPLTEDGPFSYAGHARGTVAMLVNTLANNMAFCRALDFPEYYKHTAAIRGIGDWEHST
jgi:glycosyltransferase involved in cell wall biosynthesis